MGDDSPSPLTAELRRVPLFAGLDGEALNRLAAICRRRRFRASETLFHEGDPGQTLYIVLLGHVDIERTGTGKDAGPPVHIARRGRGEHFGEMALLDDLPRSADAVAGSDGEALLLERRDLLHFLETNPAIAWNIIRSLSARLRQASDAAVRQGTLDVTGRLAAHLLDLSREARPDPAGHRPLIGVTDGQIAARVGASRETVNRCLARLRQIGAVRRDGRTLVVADSAKLRAIAEA